MPDDQRADEHAGDHTGEPCRQECAPAGPLVEIDGRGRDEPAADDRDRIARITGRRHAAVMVEEADRDEDEQRDHVGNDRQAVRWYKDPVHRRRILPRLALLGIAVAFAGCGGGSNTSGSGPVAAAASKTEQAGGLHVAIGIHVTSRAFPGGSAELDGTGAFDGSAGTLALDMTPLLRQTGAPAGIDGHVKEILLQEKGDPVMYLNLPFLAAHLPAGKSWIRLDLKKAGAALSQNFNALFNQANQTPSESLELIRGGTFTKVGTETVDGVTTTHYKGTIDLAKAAAPWMRTPENSPLAT